MKPKFQILSFFLSVMVLLSPFLAYASTEQVEEVQMKEMSCCMMDTSEMEEAHACCAMDAKESKNHHENQNKSCGDNQCHPTSCHFNTVNSLSFVSFESPIHENEIIHSKEKLNSDTYQFLLINDLSSSSWKPPKFIS